MKANLLPIACLALIMPQAALADDAGANADAYAKAVCGNGGYAHPQLGYYSYEDCYAAEFAKYLEWYPQGNGGSNPPPGYEPPVDPTICTGRIDCKG